MKKWKEMIIESMQKIHQVTERPESNIYRQVEETDFSLSLSFLQSLLSLPFSLTLSRLLALLQTPSLAHMLSTLCPSLATHLLYLFLPFLSSSFPSSLPSSPLSLYLFCDTSLFLPPSPFIIPSHLPAPSTLCACVPIQFHSLL